MIFTSCSTLQRTDLHRPWDCGSRAARHGTTTSGILNDLCIVCGARRHVWLWPDQQLKPCVACFPDLTLVGQFTPQVLHTVNDA